MCTGTVGPHRAHEAEQHEGSEAGTQDWHHVHDRAHRGPTGSAGTPAQPLSSRETRGSSRRGPGARSHVDRASRSRPRPRAAPPPAQAGQGPNEGPIPPTEEPASPALADGAATCRHDETQRVRASRADGTVPYQGLPTRRCGAFGPSARTPSRTDGDG